jgi:hypothetical protein
VERVTGIEPALSAWELACHAVSTTVFAGRGLFALPVDDRRRPSQAVASGTQRARGTYETIWMQNMGATQDHRWPTRLLRLSTATQARGCALGLLYLAGVQRTPRQTVGRSGCYSLV